MSNTSDPYQETSDGRIRFVQPDDDECPACAARSDQEESGGADPMEVCNYLRMVAMKFHEGCSAANGNLLDLAYCHGAALAIDRIALIAAEQKWVRRIPR